MRHDKIPTVIFTKKEEAQEMVYHCKYHPGCRSVRLPDGSLRCQICGSPEIRVRTIILNNPSSFESSRHSNKQKK
jgi:hypothetical protein